MSREIRVGDRLRRVSPKPRIIYRVVGFSPRGKTIMRRELDPIVWDELGELSDSTPMRAWWRTTDDLPDRYELVES